MKLAKKICLIGRFAAGKTSLVRQFVDSQFDEKYKTTVGVSISTKQLSLENTELSLVIWDIAGFEQDNHYKMYMRGVHGIIWVVDGTEPESLYLINKIAQELPEMTTIPSVCFINKLDLSEHWLINKTEIQQLSQKFPVVLNTSAKTGKNVATGFEQLAKMLIL